MTEVKRGTLKYYHRGLLNKKWKEYRFILYDSSLFTWYSDIKHRKPDGMVLLKDVERFICVGPYTRCLPDFPHLEHEYDQVALIAFPMSIKDRDREIVWLLCEDVDDLNSWMKAIVQTLPSHTLRMEKMPNLTSASATEEISSESEINSPSVSHSDGITMKLDSIRLPLAAGLLGSRLQGNAMKSRENPLQKAGYDYGDTLWGTGEGWGYFSSSTIPGYAGLGGSGCYANHIDLIRNDEDEEPLKKAEDQLDPGADDEEAVEAATYELSKHHIADEDGEERDRDEDEESERGEDTELESIKEDLHMIDAEEDD